MTRRVKICVSTLALAGLCHCSILFDLSALDPPGGSLVDLNDAADAAGLDGAGDEDDTSTEADAIDMDGAVDTDGAMDGGAIDADGAVGVDARPTADTWVPGPTDATPPRPDVADVSVGPVDAGRDAPVDAPWVPPPSDARPEIGPPPFDAASCNSFPLSPSANVQASSQRFPSVNTAVEAVDMIFQTRWETKQQLDQPAGVPLPPQWLALDFGSRVYVTDVQILWQDACAQTYDLQMSDNGVNWTTIPGGSVGNNSKSTMGPPTGWSDPALVQTRGLAGVGRYLRVYATARCAPSYGYSIWEMRALGHGVTTCGVP